MRKTLVLLLLLTLCPPFLVQDKPQTEADFKLKIKGFKNNKRFAVDYDKFKDQTRIAVGTFSVGGDGTYIMSGAMLSMGAYFFFNGKELKDEVAHYILYFNSSSTDWRFLRDSRLYALVDGERFELGEGTRRSEVRRGGVTEQLLYKLPAETFKKFADAKLVEFRVGAVELKLKDEHMIAFRDLQSLAVLKDYHHREKD